MQPRRINYLFLFGTSLVSLLLASCLNEVGALCTNDTNCPTGQSCQAGTCQPSDGGPADGGLFVPASHRSWPVLTHGGANPLAHLTLVTLLDPGDSLSASLTAFGDDFAKGPWLPEVGAPYNVGPAAKNVTVKSAAFDGGVSDAQVVDYIAAAIDAGLAPPPNGETVYLVFLPPNAARTEGLSSSTHSPFPSAASSQGDSWAVVARGTTFSEDSQLDELTNSASHQIIDAATDPLFQGWLLPLAAPNPWNGSIWEAINLPGATEEAQLCYGTRFVSDAGFEYTRSYANSAGDADPCLPSLEEPYYSVAFPQDWYPADGGAGSQMTIPFTGWSTAATANWFLLPAIWNWQGSFGTLTDSDIGLSTALGSVAPAAGCGTEIAMNNGQTGTLQLTVPSSAVSGDFAVLGVESHQTNAQCADPPASEGDGYHLAVVGVYVP